MHTSNTSTHETPPSIWLGGTVPRIAWHEDSIWPSPTALNLVQDTGEIVFKYSEDPLLARGEHFQQVVGLILRALQGTETAVRVHLA